MELSVNLPKGEDNITIADHLFAVNLVPAKELTRVFSRVPVP